MARTELILIRPVPGLGGESDQITVAAGYARNYLLPQGYAVPVTGANKKRIETLRKRRGEREAHELQSMTELSQTLSKLPLVIKVKTGDEGKMFGSVTAGTIIDELKNQFDVSLEKKKVHLPHPLRAVGDHEVDLHLHPDIHTKLQVRIESTTPLPPPPARSEEEEAKPKRVARGRRRSDEEA